MKKVPILLLTYDRPTLLERVLARLIQYTDWNKFDLWILDNLGTASNRKIINMFKDMYDFINIYTSSVNHVAIIQNEIIEKLKADIYIKIDDDILVSEGWTDGLVGVYERHYQQMSFGSVIIPINGFGWIPFMEIMNLTDSFKKSFPDEPLVQDAMEVAVFKNKLACEFIWNNCLDLDETVRIFKQNQKGTYQDLFCPHHYSIGAIVFSHDRWEEMGGWYVYGNYDEKLKKQAKYQKIANLIKKARGHRPDDLKLNKIANLLANVAEGPLGAEEYEVYKWTKEKGYKIPVTTQSLVFHFAFGPVDQYLMNKVFTKIKF